MSKQAEAVTAAIEAAKKEQIKGNRKEALRRYSTIVNLFFGDHGSEVSAYQRGVVSHQLGSIHGINKNAQLARNAFADARKRLKKRPMAYSRALRDQGNFELLEGNTEGAEKLVREALIELAKPEAAVRVPAEKLAIEVPVTHGFMCRVDIVKGRQVASALADLRKLDILLQDYAKKPEYTLANLGWIIDTMPLGNERTIYVKRAIKLAAQIGDTKKQREYQMLLLGGDRLRYTYRGASSITAFGVSTLKVVIKKIT